MSQRIPEERTRRRDMLDHFEEGNDVEFLFFFEIFDRTLTVLQFRLRQRGVSPLLQLSDGEDFGRRVDGQDGGSGGQARSRRAEDAAAAADVEVSMPLVGICRMRPGLGL